MSATSFSATASSLAQDGDPRRRDHGRARYRQGDRRPGDRLAWFRLHAGKSEPLIEEAKLRIRADLESLQESEGVPDWGTVKADVRSSLSRFFYAVTGRQPMIIPIVMEA